MMILYTTNRVLYLYIIIIYFIINNNVITEQTDGPCTSTPADKAAGLLVSFAVFYLKTDRKVGALLPCIF